MTTERKGRAGTLGERFRIVCDKCGGATQWANARNLSEADVAKAVGIEALDDGLRHECAGCASRAEPPPSSLLGSLVTVIAPAGPGQPPTVPFPLAGEVICLTGTMVHKRRKMMEILEDLGVGHVNDPSAAAVVVVGDTGHHGRTSKLNAGEAGGKLITEEAFWLAVQEWNAGNDEEAKTIIDAEYTVVERDDGGVKVMEKNLLPEGAAVVTPPPKKELNRRKKQRHRARPKVDHKARQKAINKLLGDCNELLDELNEVKL